MKYLKFDVNNYKAIKVASIDLSSEGLVLLLGINESGKTSALRSIESFDHTNDPEDEIARLRFYKRIRNKHELNSKALITAKILIEKSDKDKLQKILEPYLNQEKVNALIKLETLSITRTFCYQGAEFTTYLYNLDDVTKSILNLTNPASEVELCKNVLKICPSIQYFEDFKDQIPDYVSLTQGAQWYDPDWSSTIEGLFYHSDSTISVEQFQNLTDVNARETVLNKVNLALNKQFTDRWNRKLKGVKTIKRVELEYLPGERLFTFKIVDADGVTVFAIDERSKGALWYLTFLLKTEFRKRKLRAELGKTLYLIDEPGSNLHSSAQLNMVTDFRTLASDSNVVYTTHSQYLIDKENLSNVYIVECVRGIVKVKKYQEYLQGKKINTSYYQPIIDALEIQPFSLAIPWQKVLIVEGVYDYCGFKFMFEKVLKEKLNFVILPGTGASGHNTLISLHLGWNVDIFVLLDNDDEGRQNQKNYIERFPTIKNRIKVLDFLNLGKNVEFENLFTTEERQEMSKISGFNGIISKKAFQQTIANILYSSELSSKAAKILSQETINRFKTILDLAKKELML